MKPFLALLLIFVSTLTFGQTPELVVPSFHASEVLYMSASNNGKYVLSIGRDYKVKIWTSPNRVLIKEMDLPGAASGYFTANDAFFVINTSFSALVFDVSTYKLVSKIENIKNSTPSKNSSMVYFSKYNSNENFYSIFSKNVSNGVENLVVKIAVDNSKIKGVRLGEKLCVSNNDEFLLSTDSRGNSTLINLNTKTNKTVFRNGLAFLPDNLILNVAKTKEGILFTTSNFEGEKLLQKHLSLVQYSDDLYRFFSIDVANNLLYFTSQKGILKLNYITGENLNFTTGKETAITMAGKYVWVASGDSNKITIRQPGTLKYYKRPELVRLVSPSFLGASSGVSIIGMDETNANSSKVIQLTPKKVWSYGIKNLDHHGLSFTTDGTKFSSTFGSTKKIYICDIIANNYKTFDVNYTPSIAAISNNHKYLASLSSKYLDVFNVENSQLIFHKEFAGKFGNNGNNIAFNKEDTLLAINDVGQRGDTNYADSHLIVYNVTDGKELWRKSLNTHGLFFTESGDVVGITTVPMQLHYFDAKTGVLKAKKTIENTAGSFKNDVNYNNTLIATTNLSNDIKIIDIATNKVKYTLKGHNTGVDNVAFFHKDFLISYANDKTIFIWDIKTGKLAAKLFLFEDDNWAFVTPEGLFDASQKAMETMYYVNNDEVIPLQQLYENFYTPGLIGFVLNGNIPVPTPIDIDDVKQPPTVTLKYQQGTRNLIVEDDDQIEAIETTVAAAKIIVDASAPKDKVAEMRLFHNGKLITNKSRNLTVEDDDTSNETQKVYDVILNPGENTFKAIALNSQRTESAPAELQINYKPETSKPLASGIQLHMVVIGINEYKNPKYNLNYAVADAMGFENAIKNGMSSITSKVNITFIKNNEADRNNIYSKLQEIANSANPQDVFIFYYAGHGMMSQEATPDFYLVPYDVTQIYGDDGGIKKKGISASELKQIASTIKAQKQLYVLDACQSAGALSTVAARGAAEEKAIAQLARSTGTHWLTASGSQQVATEFDQLGHGVFTYVFLDALKGKADSGDGKITVNEIKAYLESEVPELSKKYNGSPQYPSSFGFGQDFPVSIKK